MNSLQITELLPDSPHLDWVVEHHHNEWSYFHPNASLEQRRKLILDQELGGDPYPKMFLGLIDNQPVATAALIENDLSHRHDLAPWLASVFTHPDYRRQGIGGTMVNHIMSTATQLKLPAIYLFTPDQAPFYEKLGWQFRENDKAKGVPITIMEYRPLQG